MTHPSSPTAGRDAVRTSSRPLRYSRCYIRSMSSLAAIAEDTDRTIREARARLVAAVRAAHRSGMTQTEIAAEIGRSQPEVSRLLRLHETGPLARRLRARRSEVLRTISLHGGRSVRVFGSVATGHERPDSDIDLLFSMDRPLSLMEMGALEAQLADAIGVAVDLVPESSLAPHLRDRVLAEAVPL